MVLIYLLVEGDRESLAPILPDIINGRHVLAIWDIRCAM